MVLFSSTSGDPPRVWIKYFLQGTHRVAAHHVAHSEMPTCTLGSQVLSQVPSQTQSLLKQAQSTDSTKRFLATLQLIKADGPKPASTLADVLANCSGDPWTEAAVFGALGKQDKTLYAELTPEIIARLSHKSMRTIGQASFRTLVTLKWDDFKPKFVVRGNPALENATAVRMASLAIGMADGIRRSIPDPNQRKEMVLGAKLFMIGGTCSVVGDTCSFIGNNVSTIGDSFLTSAIYSL